MFHDFDGPCTGFLKRKLIAMMRLLARQTAEQAFEYGVMGKSASHDCSCLCCDFAEKFLAHF